MVARPALASVESPPLRQARERLIVALDFPREAEAVALVEKLEGACQWFKVGLELYLTSGNSIVEHLQHRGHSVFLDLKLHDIPNTVAGAVRSAAALGVEFVTVHASGGPEMLKAAVNAASLPSAPRLLAVTVLTSMDELQLLATGVSAEMEHHVLALAEMAALTGVSGFVCSPQELSAMRAMHPQATLVTPGIRPMGSAKGDQKRTASPAAALAAGADYIVVGRPITQVANPGEAARAILEEMQGSMGR